MNAVEQCCTGTSTSRRKIPRKQNNKVKSLKKD